MRRRFIWCGMALGNQSISDFRLISSLPDGISDTAIRVYIPDDLELYKSNCDPYSVTNDKRTLDDLGYDILILEYIKMKFGIKGEWVVHNELKGLHPYEIYDMIRNGKLDIKLWSDSRNF